MVKHEQCLLTVTVSLIAAIYSLIHKRNIVKEDAVRLKKIEDG
jgi:hypothetical protein